MPAPPVTCYVTGRVFREGRWYVSRCTSLPVTSQGRSEAEARRNLGEATLLFLESCLERGTLREVLHRYGWRPTGPVPPSDLPPDGFIVPLPVPPPLARALECRS